MSEKIYAWLLKLYPVHFREDYGPSAIQLFRDRLRTERGIFRRLRFWLDVIVDLVISIPREYLWQNPVEPDLGGLRISEDAVTALKRSAAVAAFCLAIFVLLGFTVGWLGNSERVFLFATYIVLTIGAAKRFGSIQGVGEYWRSYQLVLEADRLQQTQHGRDVTMLRDEAVKINEDQHGLTIIGFGGLRPDKIWVPVSPDQAKTIWIPAGLTGYHQVRDRVLQWVPRNLISRRRSLWLSDPRPAIRRCTSALLPSMLLVHSPNWFLVIAFFFYVTIAVEIMAHVVRPPRNSGLAARGGRLNLPSAAYMWHRFTRYCRQPALLTIIFLPILRAIVAKPQ
jgi:hypothetical protein